MLQSNVQPERLRLFRRVRELDFLETVCISALQRSKDQDLDLNMVIERVRLELSIPCRHRSLARKCIFTFIPSITS